MSIDEIRCHLEAQYLKTYVRPPHHNIMHIQGWLPGTVVPYAGWDRLVKFSKLTGLVRKIVHDLERKGTWSPDKRDSDAEKLELIAALQTVTLNVAGEVLQVIEQNCAQDLLLDRKACLRDADMSLLPEDKGLMIYDPVLPHCVQWYVRRG